MVSQIIVEGILNVCSSSAVNLPHGDHEKHEGGKKTEKKIRVRNTLRSRGITVFTEILDDTV